jgi:SRSO17 transposase
MSQMSLLETPEAVALLEEAVVPPEAVQGGVRRLAGFIERYQPWFYRAEQRHWAEVVLEGRLSNLQRKTNEPIARQAGYARKPVQKFVGAGKWSDESVLRELRQHVVEAWGDASATLIVDGSGFTKKGDDSCGVARQWCGRLGKVENCQVGVFTAYACADGTTLVAADLYLPKEWADDEQRRAQTYVPEEFAFREKWRLGLEQVERCRSLPHAWVVADDEFGRVTEFRQALRRGGECYVVDVPCNTLIRDLEGEREVGPSGRRLWPKWETVQAWAARQASSAWKKRTVRAGEKGPLVVRALTRLVQTKDEAGRVGRPERLVVVRPVDHADDVSYALSNALADVSLSELVHVKAERPRIETTLQMGKGEVGLSHYEVRSWVGWYHHMTLSLLALWFLSLEQSVLKKKVGVDHGAATARALCVAVTPSTNNLGRHHGTDQ